MLLGFGESGAGAAAIYGGETACGARQREESGRQRTLCDGEYMTDTSWRKLITPTGGPSSSVKENAGPIHQTERDR